MPNIVKDILKTSVDVSTRTSEKVFKNLVEEVGEVAKAINRPREVQESAFDETVDVLICAVDLAFVLYKENNPNSTVDDMLAAMKKVQSAKCNKWWFNDMSSI